MTLPDDSSHVFIIRVWAEPREIDGAEPLWRGVIEHVPSRTQRYITRLDDVSGFIAPYLDAMGISFGIFWRVNQWLKQRMRSLKKQN